MSTFTEFYQRFGFVNYPFAVFTAESEMDQLEKLFVEPGSYGPMLETCKKGSSLIIKGERGTGKTVLTYELIRRVSASAVTVYVDNFSDLKLQFSPNDFYKFILDRLAPQLMVAITKNRKSIEALTDREKLLLSYLLKFHTNAISQQQINDEIRQIQLSRAKRFFSWVYNLLRKPINLFSGAAIKMGTDLVRQHFPSLPAIPDGSYTEYFPQLSLDVRTDIAALTNANLALIEEVTVLVKNMGFSALMFVIDKVDEDARLEGDANEIADFLQPILSDLNLVLNASRMFVISCWSIPLDTLKLRGVRFQKMSVQEVSWNANQLTKLLDQRLRTFSGGCIEDYAVLFDPEVALDEMSLFLSLANNNPRDLWHLMNAAFSIQFDLDSGAKKIGLNALRAAKRKFVKDFNFYEYYPRNAKARSNTMDVYGYIGHLLKLQGPEFTKNELSAAAGISGSSIANYVTGMCNMGLITETENKRSGGVIYRVRDPKVKYAIVESVAIG